MLSDRSQDFEVVQSISEFVGRIWYVRRDTVVLSAGEQVVRDYIVHPGAVGVIALNDNNEVLVVEQYRHPMGKVMWEPPAGLLDKPDEDPLIAIKRELYEETGYQAGQWHVLYDYASSPGGSTEMFRCYLARDLSLHPDGLPDRTGEEKDMPISWQPIELIDESIQQGTVSNPVLVTGVLTTLLALQNPDRLRPADAPWPSRDDLAQSGRIRH